MRAIAAGVLGGLLAAAFVGLVVEDSINAAIAIEEAATPDSDDEPLVSRGVQVIGGLLATVFYGLFTGTIFGTVFGAVRHRITLADDFRRSILLALAGFTATAFIPALKYPANPPGIGDVDTVGQRTVLYFTLVGASLLMIVAVGGVYRRFRSRLDQPSAMVAATLVAVAGFVALLVIWPSSPDSVTPLFPADLLWRFRLESLTTLAISWATLGLGCGWLLTRPRLQQGSG